MQSVLETSLEGIFTVLEISGIFTVLETSSGDFHRAGDFFGRIFTLLEISGIFMVLETFLEIFTVLETSLEGFSQCWRPLGISQCWRRLRRDFHGAGDLFWDSHSV